MYCIIICVHANKIMQYFQSDLVALGEAYVGHNTFYPGSEIQGLYERGIPSLF